MLPYVARGGVCLSAILGRVESDGRPIDSACFLGRFVALAPYGPDHSDHWIEGPVALGRHLLHLTPAADHERSIGPTGDLVVIADAVLNNRVELAKALGMSAERCNTASDTELIARSFMKWRKACVERLFGDFAFAVVNRTSRDVFLACDHIGSRPLYWARRTQSLFFSTAIEAIVGFPDFRWPIDERVIAEYLAFPLAPVSKPFFTHVEVVPPGGRIIVSGRQATVERWWRPSTRPTQGVSAADAVTACRAHLERAIADCISAPGPVGAHMSGGIDSTGVSVIAARQLAARDRSLKRAYAWPPPVDRTYPTEHRNDERARLEALAAAEAIDLAFGGADGVNLVSFLDRPMEFEGEADLADEVPILSAARDDGLRVLLSGWGGDEAFSAHGRGYLGALVLGGRFEKAKRFAHAFSRSLKRADVLLSLGWRHIVYPLLPNFLHARLSPYRSYIRNSCFMSAELMKRHGSLHRKRAAPVRFGISPNANLKVHITAGYISMRMRSWAAWSAPFSFQYRYPLTDRRLLEFLFTLPPEHIFMDDLPRGLARRALGDCVPPSASKEDIANERKRQDSRTTAWRTLAAEVDAGHFADDCPWLDTNAFRAKALTPGALDEPLGTMTFTELHAAARIWSLYRRAIRHGWV